MRKFLKSGCALLLAVLMMVQLMPVALFASAESVTDTMAPIYLDTPVTVRVTQEEPLCNLYFIPEVSGRYSFYSSSDGYFDSYGYIYDANWNYVANDDDNGGNGCFKVTANLTAGETYILQSRQYSYGAGTFTVTVSASVMPKVKSITAEPIQVIENLNGWDAGDYYHYEIYGYHTKVRLELENGVTLNSYNSSYVFYDGENYEVTLSIPQGPENPLLVGNTYEATVSCMGASCTTDVSIIPNPVVSMTAAPVTLFKDNCDSDYNGYISYSVYGSDVQLKVTLSDGTVLTNDRNSGVYYNNQWYSIDVFLPQGPDNPLQVGNTYTATVYCMGATCTLPVTIIENPVASITAPAIDILENTDGYDTGEYFHYNVYSSDLDLKITLNDGTVLRNNGNSGIEYNNKWYPIEVSLPQSAENPLVGGRTYEATVTCMGIKGTVPVSILTVTSVQVDPLQILETTNGYDNGSYFYYHINAEDLSVTVTLSNGTTLSNRRNGQVYSYIVYDGHWYDIEVLLPQSEDTPMLGGNTYDALLWVMGAEASFPASIVKSPVKAIEVCDAWPIYQNDYSWVENGVPRYEIPAFTLKVFFENGEQAIVKSDAEHVRSESNQYEFPWTVGGLNIVTVSYLGATTQFNVEILPNGWIYEYMQQDDEVYITACYATEEDLEIPSEIDGLPVKGILSLAPATDYAVSLTIPDSVTYVAQDVFGYWCSIEKLHLGAGIAEIDWRHLHTVELLSEITVSSGNANYAAVDGVLYNKALDTLVYYPPAKGDTYVVPNSVMDITVLDRYIYGLNLEFESGNSIYVTVDGVTYTKDMKKVISCDPDKTGTYTMPETVESIAEFAFSGSSLSHVTVSPKVTEIVYHAFENSALQTITLPEGLESIGRAAFECSSLEELELPQSLQYVDDYAFACTNLQSIEIPASLEMGYNAFAYCQYLSEITLAEGRTEIGNAAFYNAGMGADSVQVNLPDTLEVITDYAFASSNIHEIELPESLIILDDGAFANTGLTEITIPNSVTIIGNDVFSDTMLTEITIPASVIAIGGHAFAYTPLTDVVISDTVTFLGSGAFAYSDLQTFTIGTGITDIPDACFMGIPATKVTIPAHIQSVGDSAFARCDNLKTVVFEGDEVTVGFGAFSHSPIESVNLESVAAMGDYAFMGHNIVNLVIPENVTEITYGAFYSSTLETIDLPDTIEKVSGTAFGGRWYEQQASGWMYVDGLVLYDYKGDIGGANAPTIPEGVRVLADYSMENSTFNTVTLPQSLVTIGEYAFHDNANLKALHIPKNVKNIYLNALWGCDSLSSLTVDGNNPYFTAVDNVLYNKDMTELLYCAGKKAEVFIVPKTVTKIHSGAFANSDITYMVFENGEVDLEYDSLLCTKTVSGVVLENCMPTIACKQSEDVAVYDFAKSNLYCTLPLSDFIDVPEYSGQAKLLGKPMVEVGETFEYIVEVSDCVDASSVAVALSHSDCFELVSVEWLQEGMLKTFDTESNMGALGGLENANINGNLLKITLRATEEVEEADVSVQIIAKNGDEVVMDSTVTKTVTFGLLGDINNDGVVSDADATYLLLHTFFADRYPVSQNCDYNGDGKVTDADAVYLLMYTFFPETYPIG